MPKLLENLARNLRHQRAARGISQEQFAEMCGLHRTYIGGIERCERNITLETLEKLALALEIDPVGLLLDGES